MGVTIQAARQARARTGNVVCRATAVFLAMSFAAFAASAHAETFVLVYVEGNVATMPSGVILSKGGEIDSDKVVRLGPADKAIFISQSGNVIHHNGPFCGIVGQSQDSDSGAPQSAGCQK